MPITQRLSLDEFLALPDEEPALELDPDGTVTQKMAPQGQHSLLQFTLCERINHFARPRRLAMAFPELRTIFGGAAYVPDVSVFRWECIPRTPDGTVANVFQAAPDIALEVVSPEQSPNALMRRCVVRGSRGRARVARRSCRPVGAAVRSRSGTEGVADGRAHRLWHGPAGLQLTVSELLGSLRLGE